MELLTESASQAGHYNISTESLGDQNDMHTDIEHHVLDDRYVHHLIEPTCEQDTSLLRRCLFNENHEFCFKKLTFRITSEGPDLTLWMLAMPESRVGTDARDERALLEAIIVNYSTFMSLLVFVITVPGCASGHLSKLQLVSIIVIPVSSF